MVDFQSLLLDLNDASFWGKMMHHFSRLSEVQDTLSDIMAPHKSHILSPRKKLNSHIQSVSLGDTKIAYIDYGTDVLIEPSATENYYLIDIPLTGKTQVITDSVTTDVDKGYISISPVTRPVKYLQEADCSLVALKVPRHLLERYLMDQVGSAISEPIEFQLKTGINDDRGKSFLQTIMHLCIMLKFKESPFSLPFVAGAAEHYALVTLLNTIPNNYSDRLSGSISDIQDVPYYVMQAQEYIHKNLNQPINLDDLVRTTGVSSRSLFYAFKKYKGISPIAYSRRERLYQVRNELLSSDPTTTTVTDTAIKWCFYNLGTFSSQYVREYGETPSKTLRRTKVK